MQLLRFLGFAAAAVAAPAFHAARDAAAVPDQFIVVIKDGAGDNALETTIESVLGIVGGTDTAPLLAHTIGSFRAFTMTVGDSSLVQMISDLAHVAYVEPDTMVTTSAVATQADAPWGLSRISRRKNGSVDYVYDSSAGEGTYSYIIDTGILIDHVDFGGRASWGANFADDGLDKDGNGHGTHVAGTTGGTTYGVAKKTNLIAVKVLNSEGKGSTSNVISGIEWAVKDASSKKRIGKAVANLSVGGPYSRATNEAAAAAVKAGLFLAVAAGNDGSFAGLYSPASESTVCTVAASTSDDSCADFSNFGYVVDIFAPGVGILSAWHNGTTETNVISGTSMATPHIAGLAAYMLAMDGPRDPVKLCERIRDMATPDVISNLGLLPELLTDNLLAYNGISA